ALDRARDEGPAAAEASRFLKRLATPSLDWLLVFMPISLAAQLLGLRVAVFITSALAIVPLAALIGRSTEQLTIRIGPRLGGLVNVVVALVLIVLYLAALAFTQVTHAHLFESEEEVQPARWSLRLALAVLIVSALLVGLESELFVSTLEPGLEALHMPPVFVGL